MGTRLRAGLVYGAWQYADIYGGSTRLSDKEKRGQVFTPEWALQIQVATLLAGVELASGTELGLVLPYGLASATRVPDEGDGTSKDVNGMPLVTTDDMGLSDVELRLRQRLSGALPSLPSWLPQTWVAVGAVAPTGTFLLQNPADATTDQDGTVSIDNPSDVDLQGGDVITATAPGNASDYMGPIVHEDWIHLPSEIDLGASAGSISVRSGQSFTLSYDGADRNPDGILAFALTGKSDTAMVCRFTDDGSLTVSGQHTSQMSASDEGAISFYKADIGWKAGPDGLPIRMQGLSGVTMSLDLN